MSTMITLDREELKITEDITDDIALLPTLSTYLEWENGRVLVIDWIYEHDLRSLETELDSLRMLGVRGWIIVSFPEHFEWTKYVLEDDEVKEYAGVLTFGDS